MIYIRWPDGRVDLGRTHAIVLQRINEARWNRHLSEQELRQALANRAWVWSKTIVNPYAPADVFIRELAAADLFRLEES